MAHTCTSVGTQFLHYDQDALAICHYIKCFLFEQNPFSHSKVISKDASVAFLLPLGVQSCNMTSSEESNILVSLILHL